MRSMTDEGSRLTVGLMSLKFVSMGRRDPSSGRYAATFSHKGRRKAWTFETIFRGSLNFTNG